MDTDTATKPLFPSACFEDLYPNEHIILPATDGTEVLADARDIFSHYIDAELSGLPYCRPMKDSARPETEIKFLKQIDQLSFKGGFGRLSQDLRSLCLTQHQIRVLCEQYAEKIFQRGLIDTFILMPIGMYGKCEVVVLRDCYGPVETLGERNLDLMDLDYDRIWKPYLKGQKSYAQFVVPLQALGQ